MSDWGKGTSNNDIGWGQGFNNNVGWGSVYSVSESGQTDIAQLLPNLNFQFTINTANLSAGSSTATQFKLPINSSFNGVTANVDWGDGSTDTITAFNAAAVTHTYASSGIYEIKISNAMRGWQFQGQGDRLKMLNISSYGILTFNNNMTGAFQNCSNMTQTATNAPIILTNNMQGVFFGCTVFNGNVNNWDMSNCINISRFFQRCSSFNRNLNNWDVSKVVSLENIFSECPSFNGDVTNWNTQNVLNFQQTFNLSSLNQNLSSWNILKATNLSFVLGSTPLSTANYDAILIGWNNQAPFRTLSAGFGNAKYTLGGAAEAARVSLISTSGWTITDGGGI
jgi:hypothetical protein